jgi:hypothetical protein
VRRSSAALLVGLLAALAASVAARESSSTAPTAGDTPPDLSGVWNFTSIVPLERSERLGAKARFSRAEFDAHRTATHKGLAAFRTLVPIESVGVDWFDNTALVEDLRTSLITYPPNGRLPSLVGGLLRMPRIEDILADLGATVAVGAAGAPGAVAAAAGPLRRESYTDFSPAERCLSVADVPLVPQLDGNFVRVVQSRDTVVLLTDFSRRIIAIDSRARLRARLRSSSGTSVGYWEGGTLVVETDQFDGRTPSFAGAGDSRDKIVTERFTRKTGGLMEYAATIVDSKTFQDRIELGFPMALVNAEVYESACHEGNYSLRHSLSASRRR